MTTLTSIASTTRAAKGGTGYAYAMAAGVDAVCGFENVRFGLELPQHANLDSNASQWSIQIKREAAPPGT